MHSGHSRLERVLERHRDAALVEHRPGRHTVVRRDQLLADPADNTSLDEDLARWARRREETSGVSRYHLRPDAGIDVGELVADLRDSRRGRNLSVSPNHLLRAEPGWWFGPATAPEPAPEFPAPPRRLPTRPATVAVLDTGLSAHPWFEGREWYETQWGDEIAEVLDADHDYELDTVAGHGTFIAGVALQRASSIRLVIDRLLSHDGICDELELVQALRQLRHQNQDQLDIVNLSLGCYTFDDDPTPVVQRAIADLGQDVVVVACAGNDGADRPFWPAALDEVIGVAALDADGESRAGFSNYGEWVDACAIGVDVHSCFVTFDGPEPAVHGEDPDRFRGYARWSGTSFATPVVAGAIAAYCTDRGVPAARAARTLLEQSGARRVSDLGAVVGS